MVGENFIEFYCIVEVFKIKLGWEMKTRTLMGYGIQLQKQPQSPRFFTFPLAMGIGKPTRAFPLTSDLVLWLAFTNKRSWKYYVPVLSQETGISSPFLGTRLRPKPASWKMSDHLEGSWIAPSEGLEELASTCPESWSQTHERPSQVQQSTALIGKTSQTCATEKKNNWLWF